MAFLSLATVRSYVGASVAEDALLTVVRDGVERWLSSSWIPAYLGSPDTLTEILDGPTEVRLGLSADLGDRAHTVAHQVALAEWISTGDLVSIQFRDGLGFDWYDHDADDPSDFSDFEVDRCYLIRRSYPWPAGTRAIKVSYSAGYEEDAGPADWRIVALESVRALWRTRASQGLRSAAIGPMSASFERLVEAGVPPAMLNSIRRSVY